MDQRSPPKSKTAGKRQPAPPRRGIPFWALAHLILGLVLIVAGALKSYELGFEAQDESTPILLMMLFAEIEMLGGIWMAGWFDPVRTRWWAVAAFVGLGVSSLFQAIAGKCSCGCFGSLSANPWFVLLFDLAAVTALLSSRPRGDPDAVFPSHAAHWLALGTLALTIGVAGWLQADLVTLEGKVMVGGQPLEEATLSFTGESGKIFLRTEHDGHFRLPAVRPGLYAVSVPGRVRTSTPTSDKTARGLARTTARRSRQRPVSPRPTTGDEALRWIEIPVCSQYDKLIEF
jgi:hypothetical protein